MTANTAERHWMVVAVRRTPSGGYAEVIAVGSRSVGDCCGLPDSRNYARISARIWATVSITDATSIQPPDPAVLAALSR